MAGKLRVVHIVPALFGGADGIFGGAERYVVELARHMADVTPTELISFGPNARQEQMGNLSVRVLGKAWHLRGQKTNPFSFELFPLLARFDVLHLHQQHVMTNSVSAIVGRLMGRRVFVTELGGGGWDISGYISTDRLYHGHLHISNYSRRIFGHESLKRAAVIWGGIDIHRFRPAPTRLPGPRPIVFVGRLMPHKGIDALVDALPPGMTLHIIGRPYHAEYFAELQRRAQGKDVVFRQGCSDDELVAAYQQALCVVLPSIYRTIYGAETLVPELLGQTLLEGMACGIPAVCTDVASMPEINIDGKTGFVVPPYHVPALSQALIRLRDDATLAAEMGRNAVEHIHQHFTWDRVVQLCLEYYKSM